MQQGAIPLEWLPGRFAVCRLDPSAAIPEWAAERSPLLSVTRSREELSIVAPEENVPDDVRAERGFAAMRVKGTLDFNLVGILATLTKALADAEIPVFVISTFETDYLLVREADRGCAAEALGVGPGKDAAT